MPPRNDLARIADALEAIAAELRAQRMHGTTLARRRAREPGRARLPAAEAARRARESAGEIDEVTRQRVTAAMRRAGVTTAGKRRGPNG